MASSIVQLKPSFAILLSPDSKLFSNFCSGIPTRERTPTDNTKGRWVFIVAPEPAQINFNYVNLKKTANLSWWLFKWQMYFTVNKYDILNEYSASQYNQFPTILINVQKNCLGWKLHWSLLKRSKRKSMLRGNCQDRGGKKVNRPTRWRLAIVFPVNDTLWIDTLSPSYTL